MVKLASSIPAPVRRFVPTGARRLFAERPVTRTVTFEGHSFDFTAPLRTVTRAQQRGIESAICRLILAETPTGGTCIDVGANYGFLTRVMAIATGERGRVVAFEADPEIAATLAAAAIRSGLTAVEVVGRPAGADHVRLDEFRSDFGRVDVLKIDVDGPELDVLSTARKLLVEHHPLVVVELNRDEDEIYALLCELGYTHFTGMLNEVVVPGTWPPNLIAATREVSIPRVGQ